MIWHNIKEKKPEQDQAVWYYFEYTGLNHGSYYSEDVYDRFNLPEEHPIMGNGVPRGTIMCDVFHGKKGYLTDDVTHWAEYKEEEYIDAQTSLIEFLVSIDQVPERYKGI